MFFNPTYVVVSVCVAIAMYTGCACGSATGTISLCLSLYSMRVAQPRERSCEYATRMYTLRKTAPSLSLGNFNPSLYFLYYFKSRNNYFDTRKETISQIVWRLFAQQYYEFWLQRTTQILSSVQSEKVSKVFIAVINSNKQHKRRNILFQI